MPAIAFLTLTLGLGKAFQAGLSHPLAATAWALCAYTVFILAWAAEGYRREARR